MPSISDTQRRTNFQRQLADAITTGQVPYSCEGLSGEVLAAIAAVAKAYPHPTSEQIQRAEAAFKKQMTEPVDLNTAAARYARPNQ